MRKILIIAVASLSMLAVSCGTDKSQKSTQGERIDTVISEESITVEGQGVSEAVAASGQTIDSQLPTVVDFYATWCGPCRQISPLVEQLAVKYSGKVNFIKVDVDQAPDCVSHYAIQAMPTFLFFSAEGREVDRMVGADPEALQRKVASLMED